MAKDHLSTMYPVHHHRVERFLPHASYRALLDLWLLQEVLMFPCGNMLEFDVPTKAGEIYTNLEG
jgi:hypothetical protein